ncbi:MAG: hypothetical protein LBK44_04850 [Spirochaetales bacterium]|jgi:hypothetical protein|nr:hypothetical protein [Spirochaetales bacterium]
MRRICIQCIFLFIFALVDIGAQSSKENVGIPVVVAGVLGTLEYVETAEEETGATLDRSLEWRWLPGDPEVKSLSFSDFRYTYLLDAETSKYCRVILNGELTCGPTGRLNGRLAVGGETGISSFRFDNLNSWESSETGGITVDGVSYTQAELTQIIDSADYDFNFSPPYVMTWEGECILTGLLIFVNSMELSWEDGESVLESLFEDVLPPQGTRADSETISARVENGGLEFSYNDFLVSSDGGYASAGGDGYVPFTVGGNVFISVRHPAGEVEDFESVTFNGSLSIKGLPTISRVELNRFTIQNTEMDSMAGSGSARIDGKEYPATEILNSLVRYFD